VGVLIPQNLLLTKLVGFREKSKRGDF